MEKSKTTMTMIKLQESKVDVPVFCLYIVIAMLP